MKNTEIFDDYINGKLIGDEKKEFELRLKEDAIFANAYHEHNTLLRSLHNYQERIELRAALKSIHQNQFGNEPKISPFKNEKFYQKLGKNVAMAAGVGLIAVLSTLALLSAGGYVLTKQNNEITDLRREVSELKYAQGSIVEVMVKAAEKPKYAPANFEGTGFAINNAGYLITSWHMIKDADSIFVENDKIGRALTKVVFSNPKLDVAILKLTTDSISKNWVLPFIFSDRHLDLGEKVFTLGYPRKDIVYGEGALSSLSGYHGDTTMYQISIPVNPGNSGGPLLDEQGNVVGLVRGKITSAEATGFAIKSSEIITAIAAFNNDSLTLSVNTKKNALKNVKRNEQIKRINPYVFNLLVYKAN